MKIRFFFFIIVNSNFATDRNAANHHQVKLERKFTQQTDAFLELIHALQKKLDESHNISEEQLETARTEALESAQAVQNTLDRMFLKKTLTEEKNSLNEQSRPEIILVNRDRAD